MNKLILIGVLLMHFAASAQKEKSYDNFEICVSLNTVDPILPLGNIHFADKYLDGGNYTNKSFATGLTAKYYLNETTALRLRFVYSKINIRDVRELQAGWHSIDDQRFRQTLLKFSPGYQWSLTKDKISFFGGLELPLTIIGSMSRDEYSFWESSDGVIFDETETAYTIPGGFSAGLGIFLGSNYYFTDNFGLGFDFGTAYQYTSVGGTLSFVSTTSGTSGNTIVTDQHEETIKQFKFSSLQAAINLTVKF